MRYFLHIIQKTVALTPQSVGVNNNLTARILEKTK